MKIRLKYQDRRLIIAKDGGYEVDVPPEKIAEWTRIQSDFDRMQGEMQSTPCELVSVTSAAEAVENAKKAEA